MIYVDTSVVLAYLFEEDRAPAPAFWQEPLISSRLLHYEAWNRIHARGSTASHGDDARALLDMIAVLELTPLILGRALEPFPVPVRTLDALHLSAASFLHARGQSLRVATYDDRFAAAAQGLGLALFPLS